MSKYKAKAVHSTLFDGFVGRIEDEKMYEAVKRGLADWSPNAKVTMKAVVIPVDIFYRLMELDKQITAIPFECVCKKEGADNE